MLVVHPSPTTKKQDIKNIEVYHSKKMIMAPSLNILADAKYLITWKVTPTRSKVSIKEEKKCKVVARNFKKQQFLGKNLRHSSRN